MAWRSRSFVLTLAATIGYKSGPHASESVEAILDRRQGGVGTSSKGRVLIVTTDSPATLSASDFAPWTIRGLIASHKPASLVIAALCAVTVATLVLIAVGPKAGAVTDRSTCAQWSSANVNQQDAYARLYVREHGSVSPRWGPAPAGVINAINAGCYQAFGEDVSDTATVVQAIARSF